MLRTSINIPTQSNRTYQPHIIVRDAFLDFCELAVPSLLHVLHELLVEFNVFRAGIWQPTNPHLCEICSDKARNKLEHDGSVANCLVLCTGFQRLSSTSMNNLLILEYT